MRALTCTKISDEGLKPNKLQFVPCMRVEEVFGKFDHDIKVKDDVMSEREAPYQSEIDVVY